MLGSVCKNEKQTLSTLKSIKAAGYDAIELNRFMIHPTSFLIRMMTKAAGMPVGKGGNFDWQTLIKESNLMVMSLHTDLGSLEREPEAIVGEAKSFGTRFVVITGMYRFNYADQDAVTELAGRLNAAGEKLKENGLELLYHNHNVELLKVFAEDASPAMDETGKPLCALDLLIQKTDPDLVGFELDTFWLADAGADPKKIMDQLGSRMKLWHIADRGSRLREAAMTPILKEDSVELGSGNMDLTGLMDTALKNGVQGIILESHRNWIDKDPIKSLTTSGRYLHESLLRGEKDACSKSEM